MESVSRRADYILTYPALQRGRPTPSRLRVHATAGPRAIHGGLRHVADVPTFAGIPAHDFRYGHAHALPCAAVVIYAAIPYPSTFGFRPPLIRSVANAGSPANNRRARVLRGCQKCSLMREGAVRGRYDHRLLRTDADEHAI